MWNKLKTFLKWAVAKPEKKEVVSSVIRKEEPEVVVKKQPVAPKRARTKKGRYVGDDTSTPDVNEAWVGGQAPSKSGLKKKKKKKKRK